MNDLREILVALVTSEWTRNLAILVVLDLVSGVAAALSDRTFQFAAVAEFLRTKVLPFGLVLSILAAGTIIVPENEWLPPATATCYSLVVAALLASIAGNLKALGLPIPLPGIK